MTHAEPAADARSDAPPIDDGVPLATLQRGNHEELRVRWRTYKNHHFLDIRVWTRRGVTEPWWPGKKGVTIKARELSEFATAIQTACGLSR